MHILILAPGGPYTRRRLEEAATKQNHSLTLASMNELTFVVHDGVTEAYVGDVSILDTFDAVVLRHFYPTYISEGLFLAELAATHDIHVFDSSLPYRNFIYNKWYNNWKMSEAGLPVIEGFNTMRVDEAFKRITPAEYPIIAKGVHGGQGRYVFKVDNAEELRRTMTEGLVGRFMFQKYIPIEHEYRVLVIGGRAIGAMEKIAAGTEFRHNIAVGGEGIAAELDDEMRNLCEQAAAILGYEFAGVDIAVSQGKWYIVETNRCPGFEGFETATGIDVADAFIRHIATKSKIIDKTPRTATLHRVAK